MYMYVYEYIVLARSQMCCEAHKRGVYVCVHVCMNVYEYVVVAYNGKCAERLMREVCMYVFMHACMCMNIL
jgi:hypothetical protein